MFVKAIYLQYSMYTVQVHSCLCRECTVSIQHVCTLYTTGDSKFVQVIYLQYVLVPVHLYNIQMFVQVMYLKYIRWMFVPWNCSGNVFTLHMYSTVHICADNVFIVCIIHCTWLYVYTVQCTYMCTLCRYVFTVPVPRIRIHKYLPL